MKRTSVRFICRIRREIWYVPSELSDGRNLRDFIDVLMKHRDASDSKTNVFHC